MTIGGVSDIPVCSITMDSSKGLLASIDKKREGTITLSASLLGGPFMSDFSSWGPTPSLNLKPEITAHGGEITLSLIHIFLGRARLVPGKRTFKLRSSQ